MKALIYVRASTKEQDAHRVLNDLIAFSGHFAATNEVYSENISGTQLERPMLNKLLEEANHGDVLIVESVDRLSRLSQRNFEILKLRIKDKGLRLIVLDLPTTHQTFATDDITSSILELINNLLIDLLATMSRLDNDKRKERIRQGLARSGYKATGKKKDEAKHNKIKLLIEQNPNLTKEQIAALADVGVATVYRAIKQ